MLLFILWGRGKSDRSLWILLALLCFALAFSSSSAWHVSSHDSAWKIEGPPPNYVLLLQICSHFPKVSYTWTSLFNGLEDFFWWNKSGCCETHSGPVTVIAGNRAACYKISKHSLYLTPMSLQHKEGRTSSGQCKEYNIFHIRFLYEGLYLYQWSTGGRNRCRPLAPKFADLKICFFTVC